MDIEDLKLPEELFGDGVWVAVKELGPDAHLRVRPMWNTGFRRRYDQLVLAVPAERRVGGVDPDDDQRITGICVAETVLTGWRGLTSKGEDLPFSAEAATRYCTDQTYIKFRRLVIGAALSAEEAGKASIEAEAGN